jgi:hypothetical protein
MRKLLAYSLMVASTLVAIELGARVLWYLFEGAAYPSMGIEDEASETSNATQPLRPIPPWLGKQVLHPFLGFVLDPAPGEESKLGFHSRAEPVQRRSADKFIVALFGGSVAFQQYPSLQRLLEESLRDAGIERELQLIRAVVGGHRQPQQLMSLSYLYFLGAEFDLVINLDGYNEIGPAAEAYFQGVFPFYPWEWHLRTRSVYESGWDRQLRRIERAREDLETLQAARSSGVCELSAVCGIVRRYRWHRVIRTIMQGNLQLAQDLKPEGFEQTGPHAQYPKDEALLNDLVEKWSSASLMMAQLARSRGAHYIHFLQPNQYQKDSKVLSPEEIEQAFTPERRPHRYARLGYPLLRKRGVELREQEVDFVDGSMVFEKITDTVYSDRCCHLNERGQEILSAFIVERIFERAIDSVR